MLGVVWLFSNVCLIYGGYSEAKNWIVIYTTGKFSILLTANFGNYKTNKEKEIGRKILVQLANVR